MAKENEEEIPSVPTKVIQDNIKRPLPLTNRGGDSMMES